MYMYGRPWKMYNICTCIVESLDFKAWASFSFLFLFIFKQKNNVKVIVAYVEVGDSRICAITLRDRGEEMMRNPSCIVVLFHVNN
jgi:hypothetical protein